MSFIFTSAPKFRDILGDISKFYTLEHGSNDNVKNGASLKKLYHIKCSLQSP